MIKSGFREINLISPISYTRILANQNASNIVPFIWREAEMEIVNKDP